MGALLTFWNTQKKALKMFEHSNNSVIEMEKMSFLSVVLSTINSRDWSFSYLVISSYQSPLYSWNEIYDAGKCSSGKCLFGEMSLRELPVWELSIREMSSGNCPSGKCPSETYLAKMAFSATVSRKTCEQIGSILC